MNGECLAHCSELIKMSEIDSRKQVVETRNMPELITGNQLKQEPCYTYQ